MQLVLILRICGTRISSRMCSAIAKLDCKYLLWIHQITRTSHRKYLNTLQWCPSSIKNSKMTSTSTLYLKASLPCPYFWHGLPNVYLSSYHKSPYLKGWRVVPWKIFMPSSVAGRRLPSHPPFYLTNKIHIASKSPGPRNKVYPMCMQQPLP